MMVRVVRKRIPEKETDPMSVEPVNPIEYAATPAEKSGEPSNRASQTAFEERLQFETLLADMSTRFVNLPADRIDQEIEHVLERIAEVLHIERCSVAQFSEDRAKLRVTHAFAAPGVTPMPDLILNEQQPWYTQQMLLHEPLVMNSVEELPEEASVEKAYCIDQGVKSSVLIPLAVGGSFLGVVGFAALTSERQWPAVLVQRLKMLGMVFANALMRKASELKLRQAFKEIEILKDRLEAENTFLREEIKLQNAHEEIIGQSDAIKHVLNQVEQVAGTDTTVMLLGETGTGKELFAQAIHKLSRRKTRTMVAVNCGALPSNLVESELFGHEKGAFTGAVAMKKGRFELADGGTLFLDEIGELSPSLQVKLLRILQEKVFERVGGVRPITVNIRLIAATNKSLKDEISKSRFREDLFYRLNVVHIILPPLRDRQEDIQLLAAHFIEKYASEHREGLPITHVDQEVQRLFYRYNWPGNVRELENVIERAMVMCSGQVIRVDDLPIDFKQNVYQGSRLQLDSLPDEGTLYETLAHVEKEMILHALEKADYVQTHAAELLGIGKSGLNQKLKKYEIDITKLSNSE
jgi:transcriptional regulator with GAF, ATPase, and Fis domain